MTGALHINRKLDLACCARHKGCALFHITCLDNVTVNKISFPLRIKDGGRNKVKLTMVIYSHYINVQVRTRLPRLVSNCFSKLPDRVHVRTRISRHVSSCFTNYRTQRHSS